MVEKTKDSSAMARTKSEMGVTARQSFRLRQELGVSVISDLNKAIAFGDGEIT